MPVMVRKQEGAEIPHYAVFNAGTGVLFLYPEVARLHTHAA